MIDGWTKLYSSLVTSSIWQESKETKLVWITMLALKDARGVVEGSIPGLAHIAGVTVEECSEAIKRLKAPDPYSRSKEQEGRRVLEVEGGWQIINHYKYRDEKADYRKEYNRIKQREYRAKKKQKASTQIILEADPAHPGGIPVMREVPSNQSPEPYSDLKSDEVPY